MTLEWLKERYAYTDLDEWIVMPNHVHAIILIDGRDVGAVREPPLFEDRGEGTGSKVRLRAWNKRIRKRMGYDGDGRPAPLIDQVHRLMHLWRAGDVVAWTNTSTPAASAATRCSISSYRP